MELYVWGKSSGTLWNFKKGVMERNNYVKSNSWHRLKGLTPAWNGWMGLIPNEGFIWLYLMDAYYHVLWLTYSLLFVQQLTCLRPPTPTRRMFWQIQPCDIDFECLFQSMESIKRVIGRRRLKLQNGNATTLSDSTAAGINWYLVRNFGVNACRL